jgi:hypothetical protein
MTPGLAPQAISAKKGGTFVVVCDNSAFDYIQIVPTLPQQRSKQ